MRKPSFAVLTAIFTVLAAKAEIYIHVNQVSSDSFPIAIAPLSLDSVGKDSQNLGETFSETVRKDLDLIGVFKFIAPASFLDKSRDLDAAKIDFSKWAVLDALALAKGGYRLSKGTVTIEAKLFDVLRKSELLSRKYAIAPDKVVETAHQFANDIVKALTGEESIFGTQIAYVCRPRGKKELCVMNFDGSSPRPLTSIGSYVLSPTWDARSQSIYFISPTAQKNPGLFRMDLSRRSVQRIGQFPGMVNGVSLDPTNSYLATTLTKDGNSEIYALNLDGSIRKRLTINADIDVSAKFSPDGKEIVFVSDRNGSPQIWKMNADGSGARQLTFKGKNNNTPAWSPNGEKIVFSGMDTDGHCDIFLMNADGSGLVRLTYDTRDNINPSWSPGGLLIAFSSNRSGRYQIYTMRQDGSKQRKISTTSYDVEMPSWSTRTP